jgi:CRP-like cAMP-binding protein
MIETPFTSLSPTASRALVDASRLRDVSAGELIFVQGEVGGSLFLVSSGLVVVQVATAGQQPLTVALRGPGEMLGEMSLFAKAGRRSATATARTRTRLLELDADAANRVRTDHRELDDLFLRILAERSATLSRRLAERGTISTEVLVARTLLELPAGTNADTAVPVTIGDLAGISGLGTDEVEIVIAAFESEQLVDCSEGVSILDRPAITAIASVP